MRCAFLGRPRIGTPILLELSACRRSVGPGGPEGFRLAAQHIRQPGHRGGVLAWEEVPVGIHRQRDRRVPHYRLHRLGVGLLDGCQRVARQLVVGRQPLREPLDRGQIRLDGPGWPPPSWPRSLLHAIPRTAGTARRSHRVPDQPLRLAAAPRRLRAWRQSAPPSTCRWSGHCASVVCHGGRSRRCSSGRPAFPFHHA